MLEIQRNFKKMNYLTLAKKSKFFKDMTQLDFNAILRCLNIRIREFKKDEIIEYEGNTARFAYLILSGRVRTLIFDEEGKTIPLTDYTKDMFYGLEYNQNKNQTYKEEFYAVEDSVILICDIKKLFNPCENFCPRHRMILKECTLELSNSLTQVKRRVYELGQSKTREKILAYLNNTLKSPNKPYKIPYSRQELADYLGVERSALSAELSKMQKEGIIKFNKNEFVRLTKNV